VLHRAFRDIAEEGLERWTMERVEGMRPRLFLALLAEGLPAKEAEKKLPDALTALGNILNDPAGRWLLGAKDGAAELPLTAHIDRRYQNKIIDRTFIDEKGVRWIIDYKTGTTRGNREHFLAEEKERYRPQLERYAEILRLSGETRPIKTALYYPMLKRLVEL
jgi:ATP-dependent exoDNAse (exonuclease V) beta subunit